MVEGQDGLEITGARVKPPLGLMPRWAADGLRMKNISEAIAQYTDVGKEIPVEWLTEYNELSKEKKNREKPALKNKTPTLVESREATPPDGIPLTIFLSESEFSTLMSALFRVENECLKNTCAHSGIFYELADKLATAHIKATGIDASGNSVEGKNEKILLPLDIADCDALCKMLRRSSIALGEYTLRSVDTAVLLARVTAEMNLLKRNKIYLALTAEEAESTLTAVTDRIKDAAGNDVTRVPFTRAVRDKLDASLSEYYLAKGILPKENNK